MKRTPFRTLASLVLAMTAATTIARANTIYDNFGPGQTYDINYGHQVVKTGFGLDKLVAVSFLPKADYTLTQIELGLNWTACNICGNDGATIDLVSSVNGLPGSTVLESWSPGHLAALGSADNLMSHKIVTLMGGTEYWIVAHPNGFDGWNWNNQGYTGHVATSNSDGASWSIPMSYGGYPAETPAFAVLGNPVVTSTPEPSSLMLLGSGALGTLGVIRRRFKA